MSISSQLKNTNWKNVAIISGVGFLAIAVVFYTVFILPFERRVKESERQMEEIDRMMKEKGIQFPEDGILP